MAGIRINGNLFYPKMGEARIKVARKQGIKNWKPNLNNIEYSEFELQAIAYSKLRNYFKNDLVVRGEYVIKLDSSHRIRTDLCLIDHKRNIFCIIEVKRNKQAIKSNSYQINKLKTISSTVIISSLFEAENIIEILYQKNIL